MSQKSNIVTLYEHGSLKISEEGNFKENHLNALELFFGDRGSLYFSLINKGVKFNQFVGVIQIGTTVIEVLPKADKNFKFKGNSELDGWRKMLIDMLKAVGTFKIHAPSSSSLKLKSNSILELYFELFLNEVETLIRKGLIKRYRKTEGNVNVLKGSFIFGKHIQQNLIHKEQFYVRYSVYDKTHIWHQLLFKTLLLIKQLNTNSLLQSSINGLICQFPEMDNITVSDATFKKLSYNRKTDAYRASIDISKLLLLNYHPDVINGRDHVLALMFDMNALWEKFVHVSLKKGIPSKFNISAQSQKHFWQNQGGYKLKMIPDLVINDKESDLHYILDTKWKNLGDSNPSPEDLRQMYVYSKYHKNGKSYLVYPGQYKEPIVGKFFHESDNEAFSDNHCGILTIQVNPDIKQWQKEIQSNVLMWITK